VRVIVPLLVALAALASGCGGTGQESADTATQPGTATENAATENTETSGDTGRMSEGEFDTLTSYDEKFASELQDWSSGYATCAKIGQAGDLAGFRDCIKDAWDGVEGAGLLAYSNATDTFDDVAKGCLTALRTYSRRVDAVYTRNKGAYEAARALDTAAMTAAFKGLPKIAKRYANASLAVRDACEPS
jgi:hypothetical protein